MTSFAISLRRRYNDAFRLQVILQCFGPVLAADAAEFHSAKRHLVVADMQRVDPDVSRLQSLGGPARFANILRPDGRAQTPHGAVRFLNTLVEIFDLEHRQHRPKGLLGDDARIVRSISQNRRQVEKSFFEFAAFGPLSARNDLGAAFYRVANLRLDFFTLHFRVHRSQPCVLVHSVADLQSLDLADQLFDKLIVNTFDHIQSFHRKTRLSAVVETADGRPGQSFIDAGFTTMVHPAASAGPTFVPISVIGKFQGTIAPHTPTGCFRTIPYILLSGSGTYDPRIFEAKPA